MDKYSFQNCQKIVVFSKDGEHILLCKRKGEEDYDGTFSFIGGKMETTDDSILDGLRREKNEEVGENFSVNINPTHAIMAYFVKANGKHMILPHYFAQHQDGEIMLSDEYSEFKWVHINELENLEPKIPNIPAISKKLKGLARTFDKDDFVLI